MAKCSQASQGKIQPGSGVYPIVGDRVTVDVPGEDEHQEVMEG